MKKFNAKLTTFLVSLFIGLILVIVGNKVNICLSLGIICIGLALCVFVPYSNEKTQKSLEEIDTKISEISLEEEIDEEERVYIIQELVKQQKQLKKQKKRIAFLFSIAGVIIALLGIVNIF